MRPTTAWYALGLNVGLIALWFLLRTVWFRGSVGCDDSLPPQPPNCELKGDVLTYLALAELAVLVATVVWLAGRKVRRR